MAVAFVGLARAAAAFLVEPPLQTTGEEKEEDASFPEDGRGAAQLTNRGEGMRVALSATMTSTEDGTVPPASSMRRHPALLIEDARDFDDDHLRVAPRDSEIVKPYTPIPSPFRSIAIERGRADRLEDPGPPPRGGVSLVSERCLLFPRAARDPTGRILVVR